MLKKLALLAVSLLILPVQTYSQPHKAQEGSSSQRPAAPTSPAAVQQTSGPKLRTEDKEHVDADVRVIQTPAKDRYDKAALGVNLILAIVGIFGIGIGICTLLFIRAQVVEMRRQRIAMQTQVADARKASTDSAKVAADTLTEMRLQREKTALAMGKQGYEMGEQAAALRSSAEAALISAKAAEAQIQATKERERARLVIRIIDAPEVSGPEVILDGMCPLRVCVYVENFGRSKAFNVRAYGILDIVSNATSKDHDQGFLQYFPQIIDEGPEKHPLRLGGLGREFEDVASSGDSLAISEEVVQQIRNGEAFVQASGMLTYEDIFGDGQNTPFCFVWKSIGNDDGGKWLSRSFWLDRSPRSSQQHHPENPY
jgi:hypothetical protein